MKKNILILSAMIIVLAIGCKSKKAEKSSEPKAEQFTEAKEEPRVEGGEEVAEGDSLFAMIQRTPCFGRCPVYKMEIYDSGHVLYEGKHFVENIGKYTTQVSQQVLDSIRDRALEIDYFKLQDKYPSQIADFPSTTTSVKIDGRRKEIYNKQGAPKSLLAFEQYMEYLFRNAEWEKVDEADE